MKWHITSGKLKTILLLWSVLCFSTHNQVVAAKNFQRLLTMLESDSNEQINFDDGEQNQPGHMLHHPLTRFVDRKHCNEIYPIYMESESTCEEAFADYDNPDQWVQDCYGCRYIATMLKIQSFWSSQSMLLYVQISLCIISSFFLLSVGFFIILN